MLKLQGAGLSKSYRGRKVVDELGIEIGQGEVVGLLGPNGAGKNDYLLHSGRLGQSGFRSRPL